MRNLFLEKNYFIFFKILSEVFFCYWRKITGMVVETAIYVSFQVFEGKHLFLKTEHYFKLLRTLRLKKMGLSVKNYFSVFSQQKFALPENYVDENKFLFRKSFLFLLSFLVIEWFLCLFAKLFSQVCQTTAQFAERKKIGELNLEKLFFQSFLEIEAKKLGLSAKQQGMILKTVAYLCRWPFSEIFLEANIFEWKFSVIERKNRFSGENDFSGSSKAHFKCPVKHFAKKMIEVNFKFCALLRTLCVFFGSEKKVSQGCQNHKLSVQRKYLGRVFLTPMLFQNIFWFWAEELVVLAENYPHGCQVYYLWVLRNISRATFLKQVLNISTFSEC